MRNNMINLDIIMSIVEEEVGRYCDLTLVDVEKLLVNIKERIIKEA